MRTSLNDIRQMEDYLMGRATTEEAELFELRLSREPGLQVKLKLQNRTYDLIRACGRKQLKAEIAAVHLKLFSEPKHRSFRERIFRIFSR